MYTKWTQHLKDPTEKQHFVNDINNSKPVLRHLLTLLDTEEKVLNRSEMDPSSYNSPSWGFFQAHKNGYRQAIFKIKQLIDLDQQKEEVNDR